MGQRKPPQPGQPAPQGKEGAPSPGTGKVTLSKGGPKVGGGLLAQMKASKGIEDERVEDAVLALPQMKSAYAVPMLHAFLEKIAPRIMLPRTSYGILKSFGNIDVTAEKVAQCLKANPYYQYQFFKTIRSMGKREELPSTEGAVILLGMQNSRNLIVSLQLLRTVRGGHPEWSKDNKLKFAPQDIVKYALKTEETLQGNRSAYSDTAYSAGLLFDACRAGSGRRQEEDRRVHR